MKSYTNRKTSNNIRIKKSSNDYNQENKIKLTPDIQILDQIVDDFNEPGFIEPGVDELNSNITKNNELDDINTKNQNHNENQTPIDQGLSNYYNINNITSYKPENTYETNYEIDNSVLKEIMSLDVNESTNKRLKEYIHKLQIQNNDLIYTINQIKKDIVEINQRCIKLENFIQKPNKSVLNKCFYDEDEDKIKVVYQNRSQYHFFTLLNDEKTYYSEKINFFNSYIIDKQDKREFMITKVLPKTKFTLFKKIFDSKLFDDDRAKTFHEQCDGVSYILVIIKTTEGKIFGGFTSKKWDSKSSYYEDKDAFLFCLNSKKIIWIDDCYSKAIYTDANNGPVFGKGYDIFISDLCTKNEESYSKLKYCYGTKDQIITKNYLLENNYDNLDLKKSYSTTGNFKVQSYEVFCAVK